MIPRPCHRSPRAPRTGALLGAGVLSVALLLGAAPAVAAPADERTPRPPDFRFLSMPDWLNMDLGDVRDLPGWDPGEPTSTNDSYERASAVVLDQVAAEDPADVLVAGDLVEGRWATDTGGYEIFGPTGTVAERVAAVRRAARLYYGLWTDRFAARGLTTHTAVGDHDLGDNGWRRDGPPRQRFKYHHLDVWRDAYARHQVAPRGYDDHPAAGPARDTAYAVRLAPEVLLVTVDVWQRTADDVVARLDRAQLDWLRRTLARARHERVDWVVVQGHTPVLGPVRTRNSSGLLYRGGGDSAFWRTLETYDVDLYLCGEVHDVTARRRGGVVQVSHGGLLGYGGVNYLLGEVRDARLDLVVRRFEQTRGAPGGLWQSDETKNFPETVTVEPDPPVVGTMRLRRDGTVLDRTGLLAPWTPGPGDPVERGRPGVEE